MHPLTYVILVVGISSIGLNPLEAQPPQGNPPFESSSHEQNAEECSTEGRYDNNTMVTFYGDSRMDFADHPGFGNASMDSFLGADATWNVQNFGWAGKESGDVLAHLKACLPLSGFTGTSNYWIANRIVYHQGGNDFINNIHVLVLAPWFYGTIKNKALNNMEKTISMFHRRKKKILLVGNYPAISYSIIARSAIDWGYVTTGAPWVTNKDLFPKPEGPTQTALQNLFPPAGPSMYALWVAFSSQWFTSVSLGLGMLEPDLASMAARRKAAGVDIEYLPVWAKFQFGPEFWVANPGLFAVGDPVHPNADGFRVWGTAVGDKIREKQWHVRSMAGVPEVADPMQHAPVDDTNPDTSGGEATHPVGPSLEELLFWCFFFGVCHT